MLISYNIVYIIVINHYTLSWTGLGTLRYILCMAKYILNKYIFSHDFMHSHNIIKYDFMHTVNSILTVGSIFF